MIGPAAGGSFRTKKYKQMIKLTRQTLSRPQQVQMLLPVLKGEGTLGDLPVYH